MAKPLSQILRDLDEVSTRYTYNQSGLVKLSGDKTSVIVSPRKSDSDNKLQVKDHNLTRAGSDMEYSKQKPTKVRTEDGEAPTNVTGANIAGFDPILGFMRRRKPTTKRKSR
jgi:hypothetical protein